MASLTEIITELETISDAFSSIEKFIFQEVSGINTEDRSKKYPTLLVNSNDIDTTYSDKIKNSNLPQRVQYDFKLFFLDDFPVSEQKTTTLHAKYTELETMAQQYLAEVKRRTEADSDLGFYVVNYESISGFFAQRQHNDRVVQLVYDFSVKALPECTLGTFDYD